ncbi:coronafacic acid synthetase [Streptomyces inusitatus]|uniref:Coronafacic acid synthetase n=1 Tax=Streptomyces inusitatus TaxID=68221 RepID=A0A918QHU3_9ACTN|nr:class I adenylate-forming enzyme family protein [Streptomyces inusitatus]GGZ48755.1 coronafacic acid synthetase [Streptomyces inusitatus]
MTPDDIPWTPDGIESYLSGNALDTEPDDGPVPSLDAIAATLLEAGLRPGGTVLIALPNGTALLRHFFAVLFAGGVPAPLPAGTPRARIQEIADRLGARLLLVPGQSAAFRDLPRYGSHGALAVALPGPGPSPGPYTQTHRRGDVVLLTSGTSGISSGCIHPLSSLVHNARLHAAEVGLRASDTVLVNLPLNYSYALVAQALAALVTGARLVISGPPFSPDAYHAALTAAGVTSSSITPTVARALLRGDWKPPGCLRMLTVGGEAMSTGMTRELLDRGPGTELYLTYGLTQAGPRVSTLAAHREPPHRLSSVGTPLPGVRVALRSVDRDGTGELLVTSPTVLRGTVGVSEGRAGELFTGPGQIATGDRFRIDADGYLHFRGRLSDFLVADGLKVSLASVRRIANSLPGVVTSATRPYTAEDGDTRFALDLYLLDTRPETVAATERALHRKLVRGERPGRIRALPAGEAGPK